MITDKTFREICLEFPDSIELPHFDKTSFRVHKKIFATLNERESLACLKLSMEDQYTYSRTDPKTIYPVPNKWGAQGYTLVNLAEVKKDLLIEMVTRAYHMAASKKPAKKIRKS